MYTFKASETQCLGLQKCKTRIHLNTSDFNAIAWNIFEIKTPYKIVKLCKCIYFYAAECTCTVCLSAGAPRPAGVLHFSVPDLNSLSYMFIYCTLRPTAGGAKPDVLVRLRCYESYLSTLGEVIAGWFWLSLR